jgi:hypothetical protein
MLFLKTRCFGKARRPYWSDSGLWSHTARRAFDPAPMMTALGRPFDLTAVAR